MRGTFLLCSSPQPIYDYPKKRRTQSERKSAGITQNTRVAEKKELTSFARLEMRCIYFRCGEELSALDFKEEEKLQTNKCSPRRQEDRRAILALVESAFVPSFPMTERWSDGQMVRSVHAVRGLGYQ